MSGLFPHETSSSPEQYRGPAAPHADLQAVIDELSAENERLKEQHALDVATINGLRLPVTDWDGKLIESEVNIARAKVMELECENARLKAALHPSDAESGDVIVKTYPDGSMLVDDSGGQRRRVKHLGTVEMLDRVNELETQLAERDQTIAGLRAAVIAADKLWIQRTDELTAIDADLRTLRRWIDQKLMGSSWQCILKKMEALQTMEDVT